MSTEPIADDAIVQMPYKMFRRDLWIVILSTNAVWLVALVGTVYLTGASLSTPKRQAARVREQALQSCSYEEYASCTEMLEVAERLDKGSTNRTDVRAALDHGEQVLASRYRHQPP